ncbi:serine/threonine-protein phosphatase [Chloracidobacterium sp. MS 40/45]|jgi:serine/threonine protein phosphatase PrpC|uniref:PP2C family protein-serine/threonine phosphatase n=1 Tax=Chloracidobacterium aggregatum TaxID=2851959 RepID=UPI001B8C990F|nr:PP2C family serine/threonine-protein phosphatase [Chloracidobacterium aggregatum]QUW01698.1 serine/threonine-protein phosphatase [Chloracidobacterium sp. MS 40/45]
MMQGTGAIQLSHMTLVVALLSDVGCQRGVNEDSALSEVPPAETVEAERKGTLVVVADGLGGHAGGDVASQMAAEVIRRVYYTSPSEPAEALREAFVEANHLIWETARRRPLLRGMGTTCTALAIRGWEAFAAHVGDTRLYLVRGGHIYQMTEDDSEVMEYVRQGRLSREAAERHPEKNILLKALGTKPTITPSFWEHPLRVSAGDRFLLASDGLHDLVTDGEIGAVLLDSPPDIACQRLVELAKVRGGHDNITVGVVWAAGSEVCLSD